VSPRPSAAVVVCTASHSRRALLDACVESLLVGTRTPDETLVVVDQDPSLVAELARRLPREVQVLMSEHPGISNARNVGLRAARSDIVAFVDDDVTVEATWLSSLTEGFEANGDVLGAGGPALPRWGAERRWMPDELLWVVGCTYRGHRDDAGPIRNPLGCNMAFRRRELVAAGGFASGFGKCGNALATCDETELSLRLEHMHGAGRIRYVPAARVRHFVPATRISWRLLVRRSISEGLAKGRLHVLYRGTVVGVERSYVRRVLAEGVPRLLVGGLVRRDGSSLLSVVAILVSLVVTGAAFLVGAARAQPRKVPAGLPRGRWMGVQ
jgi:glucosyl-dolichyl phosphate glucuronosyltransferase